MALDPSRADRLLRLCSKLPGFPTDIAVAANEARFALDCFAERRRAVEAELQTSSRDTQMVAMLRCEAQALDSAKRVLEHLWDRRYGGALPKS